MSFDLPLLPTVLTTGATGVSTGGETAVPAMGTGTSDFASLLSGSLANLNATPDSVPQTTATPVNVVPQIIAPQGVLPQASIALADATQTVATPQAMPVSAALLQVQLPAVAPEGAAAPVGVVPETATTPQALPLQAASLQATVTDGVAEAMTLPETVQVTPPQAGQTETPMAPVSAPRTFPAEARLPVIVAAGTELPEAGAVGSAPVVATQSVSTRSLSAPATPAAALVLPEATIETAPVVMAPTVKTADVKSVKSKPADSETDKAAPKTAAYEAAPVTAETVVSLVVIAPPAASVTTPVVQHAPQPVADATDQGSAPAPAGRPAPAVPQAPAADATEETDANKAAMTEAQSSSAPKFASLLNTAPVPAANASAPAVKSQAPVASNIAAATSVPLAAPSAAANVQADAQPVETASVQKQAVQPPQNQVAPNQVAPVQVAPVQAAPLQAAQTVQAQAVQTAARKSAGAPAENGAEIASTPVAAAPSGFSLVSAPVAAETSGYAPAATPQTPATSLMSQTAVDNINALSVQINRRNAEGATKFTMELHPADLGKVDVALSIGRDGKMTAHMTFDSDMTAATFSTRESDLRQQLSATGLKLSDDALSFSTRLKTDATAQAQGHAVNANARSADDSSSGNSSQQQPQNAFTQPDSQQGQQRSHSQHLAQLASRQAAADQAAADADLDALNNAIDASAARLNYRQPSSRLALDLSV